jgi:cytochrome c-type protein NapB
MSDDALHLPEGATTFFLAVVAGLAMIGFFVGTDPTDYAPEPAQDQATAVAGVPEAPTYARLRDHPRQSPNGFDDDLVALAAVGYAPGGTREQALAARSARRAYDGAPPTIPHPIRQDAAPECLACHQDGMTLRGHTATPMSHDSLTSCTQCHVVAAAPMPGDVGLGDPRAVSNSFTGMMSPVHGPRAWSIAPPQVPHRTWMRERCESCHGLNGRSGMQTPHPQRDNCEQCHAAPAVLDQRPGVPR